MEVVTPYAHPTIANMNSVALVSKVAQLRQTVTNLTAKIYKMSTQTQSGGRDADKGNVAKNTAEIDGIDSDPEPHMIPLIRFNKHYIHLRVPCFSRLS